MDSLLPHRQHADPHQASGDSATPSSAVKAGAEDELATETLMEALAAVINTDPGTGHIDGCANDFRVTEAVLRRHHQEHVAGQVIDLLRAQGAMCDCEVLLNSSIDLVFLENDLEDADADADDAADNEEFKDEFAT